MYDNIVQFLNQNSGALTVIFTAVVTISTLVYAVLTAVLVSETKKMREVQTEPKVKITLRPLESAVNIVRLNSACRRIQSAGNHLFVDVPHELI